MLRMVYGNGLAGSPLNMLVEVRDSYERIWRLTYDTKRRVTGLIDPAGRTTTYTYDDANELLTSAIFLLKRAHMYERMCTTNQRSTAAVADRAC